MKTEIIKSRLNILKYSYSIGISILILMTSLIGWNKNIFSYFDYSINPILINIRQFGIDLNNVFIELQYKSNVLDENIELQKNLAELNRIKSENDLLKYELNKVLNDQNIEIEADKKLKIIKIRGVQNIYSSSPYVILEINSDYDLEIGQAVYYLNNQLFGFVSSIDGLSAKVIPYYSPDISFNIPVENSKDKNQKGFVSPIIDGIIKIKNIEKSSDVSIGDIWVTTNDRSEISGGLIIGTVKNILENPDNGFKEIEINPPFGNVNEFRYLYIEIY